MLLTALEKLKRKLLLAFWPPMMRTMNVSGVHLGSLFVGGGVGGNGGGGAE